MNQLNIFRNSALVFKKTVILAAIFTIFSIFSGFISKTDGLKINDDLSGTVTLEYYLKKEFEIDLINRIDKDENKKDVSRWESFIKIINEIKKNISNIGFKAQDVDNQKFLGFIATKDFRNIDELRKAVDLEKTKGIDEFIELHKFTNSLTYNKNEKKYILKADFTNESNKIKESLQALIESGYFTSLEVNAYEHNLKLETGTGTKTLSNDATNVVNKGKVLIWDLKNTNSVNSTIDIVDSSKGTVPNDSENDISQNIDKTENTENKKVSEDKQSAENKQSTENKEGDNSLLIIFVIGIFIIIILGVFILLKKKNSSDIMKNSNKNDPNDSGKWNI